MENDVQLQVKTFNTARRPMLTTERREPTPYEISCRNLEPHLYPAAPVETIEVEDLPDGRYRVRATLVEVSRRADDSWYEVRVGRRHRFAYPSAKAAARAFKQLTAENLQPTGWMSSNGGAGGAPEVRRASGLLSALPRVLGWNLSATY